MRSWHLLIAVAGLPACSAPFDDGNAGPGPLPDGPLLGAYYIVQPQDLQGVSTDGTPVPDLTQYGFLVCSAALDPDEVRAAAPQALVFGYVNSHQVPLWGPNSAFWNDYRAQFDSTDFWVDTSGQRASTWPNTEEMLYTAENASTLAQFVLQYWGGWDGIYVDDCWGSLAPIVLQDLPIAQSDWPAVQPDWTAFLQAFVSEVQAGTGRPIVGNAGLTAPDMRHLQIQGVCSEEWWPAQSDIITAEFARYDPRLCVAWEWDAGDAARQGDIRYR